MFRPCPARGAHHHPHQQCRRRPPPPVRPTCRLAPCARRVGRATASDARRGDRRPPVRPHAARGDAWGGHHGGRCRSGGRGGDAAADAAVPVPNSTVALWSSTRTQRECYGPPHKNRTLKAPIIRAYRRQSDSITDNPFTRTHPTRGPPSCPEGCGSGGHVGGAKAGFGGKDVVDGGVEHHAEAHPRGGRCSVINMPHPAGVVRIAAISPATAWLSAAGASLTPGPRHPLSLWRRVCGATGLGPKPCGAAMWRHKPGATNSRGCLEAGVSIAGAFRFLTDGTRSRSGRDTRKDVGRRPSKAHLALMCRPRPRPSGLSASDHSQKKPTGSQNNTLITSATFGTFRLITRSCAGARVLVDDLTMQ